MKKLKAFKYSITFDGKKAEHSYQLQPQHHRHILCPECRFLARAPMLSHCQAHYYMFVLSCVFYIQMECILAQSYCLSVCLSVSVSWTFTPHNPEQTNTPCASSAGVISLASNIVVLMMFVKFKELRTATNFIIINLAFTDIGVAGIGYPMSAASDLHGSWKFGYTGCQVGGG